MQPKWSYQAWSRTMDQSKASILRAVQGTMPITVPLENAFCRSLGLEGEARKYFSLLVIYGKIEKLYPQLTIRIPSLEELRRKSRPLKRVASDSSLEKTVFLSRADVWWCLSLFSGRGIKSDQINNILNFFHEGLRKLDLLGTIKACLKHQLLVKEADRILFRKEALLHMDASDVGISVAIDRYIFVLNGLKAMIQTDQTKGLSPAVQNRACVIRIKSKQMASILKDFEKVIHETMTSYEDAEGDMVLDLQTFFAPICTLT